MYETVSDTSETLIRPDPRPVPPAGTHPCRELSHHCYKKALSALYIWACPHIKICGPFGGVWKYEETRNHEKGGKDIFHSPRESVKGGSLIIFFPPSHWETRVRPQYGYKSAGWLGIFPGWRNQKGFLLFIIMGLPTIIKICGPFGGVWQI